MLTRVKLRAALTDNDVSGDYILIRIFFNPKALSWGAAMIPHAAACPFCGRSHRTQA